MSIIDDDTVSNPSANPTFEEIVQARLSRRGLLTGGVAAGVAASLGGIGTLLSDKLTLDEQETRTMGYSGVSGMLAAFITSQSDLLPIRMPTRGLSSAMGAFSSSPGAPRRVRGRSRG